MKVSKNKKSAKDHVRGKGRKRRGKQENEGRSNGPGGQLSLERTAKKDLLKARYFREELNRHGKETSKGPTPKRGEKQRMETRLWQKKKTYQNHPGFQERLVRK